MREGVEREWAESGRRIHARWWAKIGERKAVAKRYLLTGHKVSDEGEDIDTGLLGSAVRMRVRVRVRVWRRELNSEKQRIEKLA
jgi:hypothetical protein